MEVHAVLGTRQLNFLSKSEDKWYGLIWYIPLFDYSWDKFVETIWQWNFQIRMVYTTPVPMCCFWCIPGTKQLPAQQQRLSGVTERGEDALGARGFFEFVDEPLNTGKTDGSDLDKTSFFLSYKCSRDSWWTADWVQMSWWWVQDKRKQPGRLPISK